MSAFDWVNKFLRDLIVPSYAVPVLPPRPVSGNDIARATVDRAIVAQLISGSKSTLLDKATFAIAPVIVDAVAQWGADQGARDRAIDGRRQGSGTVIITARSELE